MKDKVQLRAMVESVAMLKEEKAGIERSIKDQEHNLIEELMNQGMTDYLTVNWTRLGKLR